MKWYKRDPDAFFAATRALTLEERGAYNDLLDMLYARDGVVPDDDGLMARNLGCNPRTWRRLKTSLIEAGKVAVVDGRLTARRVEKELNEARMRFESMSNLGRMSAQKRKTRRKNNGGTSTAPSVTTTPTTTSTKEECVSHTLPSRARAKSPLPKNWHPELVGTEQFDGFCDHARAHDRQCADWEAARRTWNRKQGGSNGNGQRPAPKDDRHSIRGAFDRLFEKLDRADETGELPRESNLRFLPRGSSK